MVLEEPHRVSIRRFSRGLVIIVFVRLVSAVAVLSSLSFTTAALAEDDDEANTFVATASESTGPAVLIRSKEEGGVETQYTSDSMAGILIRAGSDQQFAFQPQLGYTKDGFGFEGGAIACAFGVGSPRIGYFSYQPRFLAGTKDGGLGLGMRNALAWHSAHDLFNMEIGHQFVKEDDVLRMDVRGTIGVNAGGILDLFL